MPYDADQIGNLEDELDALVAPSTEDVLSHSQDYDAGIVAAVAARLALSGGAGGSQPFLFSVEPADGDLGDGQALLWLLTVASSAETSFGAANSNIRFEAVEVGAGGNDITVGFSDADPDQELSVSTDGHAVMVVLETDGGGAVVSTAAEVIALLTGDVDVAQLLTAENAEGSTGAGVVESGSQTLTGGDGPTIKVKGKDAAGVVFDRTVSPYQWTIEPFGGLSIYDDDPEGEEPGLSVVRTANADEGTLVSFQMGTDVKGSASYDGDFTLSGGEPRAINTDGIVTGQGGFSAVGGSTIDGDQSLATLPESTFQVFAGAGLVLESAPALETAIDETTVVAQFNLLRTAMIAAGFATDGD